ncbi:aspartate aminotransferase family protein [Clostridium aestuarii]|uniref:Aspartate aminotransferase family protein n=1 Tax=Clostridium aestuarii TaxID=338193 RepID=A0ABT4CWF7_9CLOT|nr:aspartate aminotransferase family protein [Clostridium aestuarii]MCY6483328.1 aspartate aminotransferase family protein [Clostridium aestuarii]
MEFVKFENIKNLSEKSIDKMYKKHYNNGLYTLFKRIGIDKEFVKAHGVYVYDRDGNEYIDFLGGFGALNLGHNNTQIIEAIQEVKDRPNMLQVSKNTYAAVLSNNISYLTNREMKYCFFTNSGTEAVEEAIKISLLYNKEGNIIYFSNAYHGKTMGSISALGSKIKENYQPLLYNFIEVPYNNIEKFKEAVENVDIVAVLVEPIQAEGGIVVPSKDFLNEVRKICDKKDIILIFDEVQTGLGRCGAMFCYEKFGVVPDIMCLAKSLSGGVIPIGCIAVEEILWKDTYGKVKNAKLPSSTFGGNTLACAAGIKTLSILKEEELYKRAENLGNYALKLLINLKNKYTIIKDIRGMGLMLGIRFDNLNGIISDKIMEATMAQIISKLMNEYRIISGYTTNDPSVLRIEPPLIIEKKHIDYLIYALNRILDEENNIFKLGFDSIKNITKNILN